MLGAWAFRIPKDVWPDGKAENAEEKPRVKAGVNPPVLVLLTSSRSGVGKASESGHLTGGGSARVLVGVICCHGAADIGNGCRIAPKPVGEAGS
jgi:hypothetical protein